MSIPARWDSSRRAFLRAAAGAGCLLSGAKASGFDEGKLAAAFDFARANDSGWDFARDQRVIFGRPLGPVPASRAATNGLILRGGKLAAEFGETSRVDPVYSIAKSFLSTLCGLACQKGLIGDLDEPVGKLIRDGGYDSPQNALVTWKHHLQQTSEWEGTMFGKPDTFLGEEEFGRGRRAPRERRRPGELYEYNDVRINRFSVSLARRFGASLPSVLRSEIMEPISAGETWKWLGYDNSQIAVNRRVIVSVPGGTRWGGGLWINSHDLARFGAMIASGGAWNGRRFLPENWLRDAVRPSPRQSNYGYLWWLNTGAKQWPGIPETAFAALGNGSNTLLIDGERDLVIVWRWHKGEAAPEFFRRVYAALQS